MNSKSNRLKALMLSLIIGTSALVHAQTVVYDFEDYEIGQKLNLYNLYGSVPSTSYAEVVSDPTNASNKVLHVVVTGWNTFIELQLPNELAGKKLTDNKSYVTFDYYRPATDEADYKQMHIYLGSEQLYCDNGYPHQGDKNTWQNRKYAMNAVSTSADTETALHLGIHHEKSEYYIDNICLKGEYDDYLVAEENTIVNICEKNTSSNYTVYETPILVNAGNKLTLHTSRYTYWNSKVVGDGVINLMSGGERTYLGNSSKARPDWSGFSGQLHIYPYKEVDGTCGFYGMIWMHGGKTFIPDEALQSAYEGKSNNCLEKASLYLHDGATLAAEQGTRGMRIGHFETEAGSKVMGYYKSKSTSHSYYMIGADNSDALLAGQFAPYDNNTAMKLGLIKEGKGTYRITGNNNLLTGGVTVIQGELLVNNDAALAKSSKLSGGICSNQGQGNAGVVVRQWGSVGGTGNIGTFVDVYGAVTPGDQGIGTLTIADYAKAGAAYMIVRPGSIIKMEIKDAATHDVLNIDGDLTYYNIAEDFSSSDKMPQLHILLTDDAQLQAGDEMVLLTAKSKKGLNDIAWQWDVRYPKAYTWKTEERNNADGTLSVVAVVTSTDYSGQGEQGYEDEEDPSEPPSEHDFTLDLDYEQTLNTTLNSYVENTGKYIGVCVPVWSTNILDESDAKTSLITKEFNMVVCENEMKFDAVEPNRNEFSFTAGDKLANYAYRHKYRVRGHTLVWHRQVPTWLTTDGEKNTNNFSRTELLDIMKNHITRVVKHWKGKVHEWDVCNEVLSDDQSIVRTNPNAYQLRPSVWQTIGEDFLDSAFVWAHQTDPNVRLILNDYGVEYKGQAKAEAFYNLVKRLKERNVPIDGVGLQCHLDTWGVDINALEGTIKRFNDLGLKCVITELDLGNDGGTANLEQQAKDYYQIARLFTKYANCDELLIWGLTDGMSWRTGRSPLLFNDDLTAKPAYYGVHAALRQGATAMDIEDAATTTGIAAPTIVNTAYFSLSGQQLHSAPQHGFFIRVETMSDGSRISKKLRR